MVERLLNLGAPPVVGNFYQVPTVYGKYYDLKRDWVVVPPLHDDVEIIDFEYRHYHLDLRFIPNQLWRPVFKDAWFPAPQHFTASPLQINPYLNQEGFPPIAEKRRKCLRTMPKISFTDERVPWFRKLKDAYSQQRLLPGMICPHKGVCLKSMPVRDGIVECPAHGLHWHVETGTLAETSVESEEDTNVGNP